jgi:hypothetical protein
VATQNALAPHPEPVWLLQLTVGACAAGRFPSGPSGTTSLPSLGTPSSLPSARPPHLPAAKLFRTLSISFPQSSPPADLVVPKALPIAFYAFAARFLRVLLAEGVPDDQSYGVGPERGPYWTALAFRWQGLSAADKEGWGARVPRVLDWSWFPDASGLWKGPSCVAKGQAGYGVVAARPLKRGRTLAEYAGQLFKMCEGHRDGDYIIHLRRGGHYYIDGAVGGNWTRFVQHGFQGGAANLRLTLTGEGEATRAWLETRRDIAAGEELFWEYGTLACFAGQRWFTPAPRVPVAVQLAGGW